MVPSQQQKQQQKTSGLIILRSIPRNITKNNKVKIDITKTQYKLVKNVTTTTLGWKLWVRQDQKDDANVIWVDHYVSQQLIKKLKPYQKVNHFPNSHQLGRKDYLANNLNNMKKILPDYYKFYPNTWVLPENKQKLNKFKMDHPDQIYIIKPVGSCQGKGIYLSKDIPQDNQQFIVQQYISNPLLIDSMKFDIRLYVLVKNLQPLKIYLYSEGLTRLATHTYCTPKYDNLGDMFMHLTNYAINKNNPEYISNKDEFHDNQGHKRTYSAILQTLSKIGCNIENLQLEIDQIVVKTILSAHSKMLQSYKILRQKRQQVSSVCFQIYGFDIMITNNYKPILIEVNHSPSFQGDTPLDTIIKKYLILDTLNLLNINNQDKIDYLKRPSQDTSRDRIPVVKTIDLKVIQNGQQNYQYQHLGGYRKIYPINNIKKSKNNKLLNCYDHIFKKINQKDSKIKSKFRATFQQRLNFDITQSQGWQTNSKYFAIPSSISKQDYLSYTFYNHALKNDIQDDFMFLNIPRNDKKSLQPMKMNNISISFYGHLQKSKKNKKLNNSCDNRTQQKSKGQLWFRQRIYETQLRSRLGKLKLARVKLQKLRNNSKFDDKKQTLQ